MKASQLQSASRAIEKAMRSFIEANYGRSESQNPCYDIKKMAEFVTVNIAWRLNESDAA